MAIWTTCRLHLVEYRCRLLTVFPSLIFRPLMKNDHFTAEVDRAIKTRPDIMLRYVKGTTDSGLYCHLTAESKQHESQLFGPNSSTHNSPTSEPNIMKPIIASDADFSRDFYETSKSVSSYLFMLAGAPISWHLTTQPVVALSSMESEYIAEHIAACSETQGAMWLKSIIEELGFGCTKPLLIQEDNKSTIDRSPP